MEATKTETLSKEARRRIVEEIESCGRYIDREEKMDADLRPDDVKINLARKRNHMARMLRCLNEDRIVPAA